MAVGKSSYRPSNPGAVRWNSSGEIASEAGGGEALGHVADMRVDAECLLKHEQPASGRRASGCATQARMVVPSSTLRSIHSE